MSIENFFKQFNSVIDLTNTFRTQEDCLKFIRDLRFEGTVTSVYVNNGTAYKCKNGRYKCKETGKYFNELKGTVFEGTKVPLPKWFLAIYFVLNHKKGISSCQLARDIGVTQSTAWHMLTKLRQYFQLENYHKLEGIVEADETYIGGKNKNRHYAVKQKLKQGRGAVNKFPVMGMIKRGGNVTAIHVSNTERDTLAAQLLKYVKGGTLLFTDELPAYNRVNDFYRHESVNHSKGKYIKESDYGDNVVVGTNNIESYWAVLKRPIYGTYHKVSEKYLQKYIDESAFRFNTRHMSSGERFSYGSQLIIPSSA